MGALDAFSAHGDCVSNGEKWIANIWIDIIGDGKQQLMSWKSGKNWIKPGNTETEIYSVLGNPDLKPMSNYLQFKERYSSAKNFGPKTNVKIGDVRLHLNNHKNEDVEKTKTIPQSNVLKSVILLLNELRQDEVEVVAGILRNKMQLSSETQHKY